MIKFILPLSVKIEGVFCAHTSHTERFLQLGSIFLYSGENKVWEWLIADMCCMALYGLLYIILIYTLRQMLIKC